MTPNGQDFEKTLANFEKLRYNPDQSSYFDLIPQYMGNVEYDALLLENVGNCFKKMTMTRQELENGQLELNINLQDSESLTCAEAMIIATDSQFFVKEFFISGNHKVTFDAVETEAEKWDLFERGPRIFLFKNGLYSALKNLASTLYLFEPCLTEGVGETFAQANLNFLKDNAGIEMPRRPEGVPEILPIDKNLVQNGDTFDIMRLDGLDPMIAWAMGSATGHTAIALWKNEEVS